MKQLRLRIMSLMAAMVLIGVACGGGETTTTTTAIETTTTAAPTTTAPSTTTTSTSQATTTTAATTTTTTTAVIGGSPIEAALGANSGAGSLVEAGTYVWRATEPPIQFALAEESAVAVIAASLLGIGPPGFGWATDHSISIITVSGTPTLDKAGEHDHTIGAKPIEGPSDITDYLEGVPGILLLNSGEETVAGQSVPWWEFTSDPNAGGGFACPYGSNCFNIFLPTGLEPFIAGESFVYRVWHLKGNLYAWFQAPADTYSEDLPYGQAFLTGLVLG